MEYVDLVRYTMNEELSLPIRLANAGLGLTGEAGEVADMIKKHLAQGHTLDKAKLVKEMGDCYWYLTYLQILIGVTEDEVKQTNISKLLSRYPDGFEAIKSINRTDK